MDQAAVLPRLTAPASGRFAPYHRWDRNFFALLVALIWCGILMGFVPEMIQHVANHEAPFPLIVHFHAAAFLSWLLLLTTQVLLIRARRPDLHRRLGIYGAGLAGLMVVLGPATALVVQHANFARSGHSPVFLSVQFTDILAFGGLITAALVSRNRPAAHKRLVLLATLYISDAGFARWLSGPIEHLLGVTYWAQVARLYLPNDLLVLALGGYDLVTRGRLHPAYVAGVAWTALLQLVAVALLLSPGWAPLALHLIGH